MVNKILCESHPLLYPFSYEYFNMNLIQGVKKNMLTMLLHNTEGMQWQQFVEITLSSGFILWSSRRESKP